MSKIEAPFTQAQVTALNKWQTNGQVHPFTCGGERYDLPHVEYARRNNEGDMGILIARADGWFCPVCDYRQSWAHEFMLVPIPPRPKLTGRKGFAAMNPVRRREIARLGGSSVSKEKRSFSKNRELAASAGRKGGQASKGGGRKVKS